MELKQNPSQKVNLNGWRFNRTFMELKHKADFIFERQHKGFNRTFMELKQLRCTAKQIIKGRF